MQDAYIAVLECDASPEAVAATVAVLEEQRLPYVRAQAAAVDTLLAGQTPPTLAVVHVRQLTIDALAALRPLTQEEVPVLAIAEEATEEHELILLHSGAWDVLALPVSTRRLSIRITTLYRHLAARSSGGPEERYQFDNVIILPRRREVAVGGRKVELTKTEFDLLVTLARVPHEVLSRQQLVADAAASRISVRSLESHLSRLRTKVHSAGGPRLIESVRGVGYRLQA